MRVAGGERPRIVVGDAALTADEVARGKVPAEIGVPQEEWRNGNVVGTCGRDDEQAGADVAGIVVAGIVRGGSGAENNPREGSRGAGHGGFAATSAVGKAATS